MAIRGVGDAHQIGNGESLTMGQMGTGPLELSGSFFITISIFTSGKGVFGEDFCSSLYFYNPCVQCDIKYNSQPDRSIYWWLQIIKAVWSRTLCADLHCPDLVWIPAVSRGRNSDSDHLTGRVGFSLREWNGEAHRPSCFWQGNKNWEKGKSCEQRKVISKDFRQVFRIEEIGNLKTRWVLCLRKTKNNGKVPQTWADWLKKACGWLLKGKSHSQLQG